MQLAFIRDQGGVRCHHIVDDVDDFLWCGELRARLEITGMDLQQASFVEMLVASREDQECIVVKILEQHVVPPD